MRGVFHKQYIMIKYLMALFIITSNGYSQTKGDNTIIIPKDISSMEIKGWLFNNGYSINNIDTLFISTAEKTVDRSAMIIKLMIARMNGNTYLKAQGRTSSTITVYGATVQDDFSPVEFRGAKSSPNMQAWNELNRIVKAISDSVIYVKQ